MTVLVTGGAGFIGSELVRQLAESGRSVIAFDNLATGRWENLDGVDAVRMEGDVRDGRHLARVMSGVSVVFHLACLGLRHSLSEPLETHEINATGTLQVLKAAAEAGVKRLVYVSSSEVYGTAQDDCPMSETHPTFPTTPYGASKLAGESYARAFFLSYGFPAVIVRPFNTYGPRCHHEGSSGEVIPKFLLRAEAGLPLLVFGDGEQVRDFTHVSDTARGILLAGTASEVVGRTFNLGTGRATSIKSLAQLIAPDSKVVHRAKRPGDVRRLVADATLARQFLGFKPQVRLEDGLLRLKHWYASQGRIAQDLLREEVPVNWLSI